MYCVQFTCCTFCGSSNSAVIRVLLPFHLRQLAGVEAEILVDVPAPASLQSVLNVLETQYPVLRGTIRDPVTQGRRPYLRYFACKQDLSFSDPSSPLPYEVQQGSAPLIILGAIAGG